MVYIQLPFGTFVDDWKEQCDGALHILEELVPEHNIGLQLFMGATDTGRLSLKGTEKIIDYILKEKDLPPESLTIHHPFAPRESNKCYNFYFPEAMEVLRETAELAAMKRVRRVTVHFSAAFYQPSFSKPVDEDLRWKRQWDDLSVMLREVAVPTYRHLQQVAREYPSILFGVENMSMPTKGEASVDPEEVLVEPLLHSAGSIRHFLNYFKDTPNMGVCFDTAHFIWTKYFVEWMNENNYSFPGIYPTYWEHGNILDTIDELVAQEKLFDFQLGDAGKFWIPNKQKIDEGVQLSSGLGGQDLLTAAKKVITLPFVGFSIDGEPQRQNYSDEEWPHRYALKKEQVEDIKLLKGKGIL